MTSIYDSPELQKARETATSAASTYATEVAAGGTLSDKLRNALNAKFTDANPLVADQNAARQDYLRMSTQAPLNVTPRSAGGNADVIYNPLQQANLIQSYRAPSIARMATLNDLLGMTRGGMENVIDASTRAQEAAIAGAKARAELSRSTYSDLLGEADRRLSEQQKAQDTGGNDLTGFLEKMLPYIFPQKPKEEKPQGLPVAPYEPIDPKKQYFSPGGEWYFDMEQGWIPVTE